MAAAEAPCEDDSLILSHAPNSTESTCSCQTSKLGLPAVEPMCVPDRPSAKSTSPCNALALSRDCSDAAMSSSWGILINPDKSPAPLLEQLCLGIAQKIVSTLERFRPTSTRAKL